MRAYSLDLRRHLVAAVATGLAKAEVAAVFGVSVRTIDRYLRQRDQTGDLAAKPIPGRRRQIPPEQNGLLHDQLSQHPDAALVQHCEFWAAHHGIRVSPASMSRAITRLGWTWKKSHWWPPSATRRREPTGGSS